MSHAAGSRTAVSLPGRLQVTVPEVDGVAKGGVPVTVLDSKLHIEKAARSSELIDLSPGTYIVSVTLPDGSRVVEAVGVLSDKTTPLEIPWRPSSFGNLPERAAIYSAGAKGGWMTPPRGFSLRFLSFSPGENSARVLEKLPSVKVEAHESNQGILHASLLLSLRDDRKILRFVQLAAPGLTPLSVALPLAPGTGAQSCSLRVAVSADLLDADVHLRGLPEADLVSQFVAGGELAQAAALPKMAEELLYHKLVHPLGAAVGGYALLRLGALKRLYDWPENLTRWFEWLPDGPVIAGELALRQGRVEEGIALLLTAVSRGLPVFTDGYSMLVSRLRELARGGVGRALATEVAQSLERIGSYASFVDFGALLLTIRGADLLDPAMSQQPLKHTARGDGWRLFRPPLNPTRDPRHFWVDP